MLANTATQPAPAGMAGLARRLTGWRHGAADVHLYRANTHGRDFVIGDLHGCLEPLQRLLAHVGFLPARDRVFATGDLVDRGPRSLECLGLIAYPWFHSCRGNHEEVLARVLRDTRVVPYEEAWLRRATMGYGARQQMAGRWLALLEGLPSVIIVGDGVDRFHVVHAELYQAGVTIDDDIIKNWKFPDRQQARRAASWGRDLIRARVRGEDVETAQAIDTSPIFCGHSTVSQIERIAGQVYIDLGVERGAMGLSKEKNQGTVEQPGLVMVEAAEGVAWLAPSDESQRNRIIELGTVNMARR